jgi:hypothetical protein
MLWSCCGVALGMPWSCYGHACDDALVMGHASAMHESCYGHAGGMPCWSRGHHGDHAVALL